MFSGSVKLYDADDKTTASFNSDPPYEIGWAKQGSIVTKCDNWANVDNTLTVEVYWGLPTIGLLPSNDNLTWVKDNTDSGTTIILADGGTTTDVVGIIPISEIKSKYMRLTYTLDGTSKEVDVTSWFFGRN